MMTAAGLMAIVLMFLVFASWNRGPAPNLHDEGARLIALYDEKVQQGEQREECDFRLYQELKALRQGRGAQGGQNIYWAWLLLIAALLAAGVYWYRQSGMAEAAWRTLDQRLNRSLLQSQYLGTMPQDLSPETLFFYCQHLQSRIDRQAPAQLSALASCYTQAKNTEAAVPVYRQLYRLRPNDDSIALNYVQAALFASRGAAFDAQIEGILQRLVRNHPQGILPKILLASGYSSTGKTQAAQVLWQELARDTPKNHPLYPLIVRTLARFSPPAAPVSASAAPAASPATAKAAIQLQIKIAPTLKPPATARLFVTVRLPQQRIPLMAKVLPLKATQTVALSEADSMTGAGLGNAKTVVVRAKITADGNAMSPALAQVEQTLDLPASKPVTLELQ